MGGETESIEERDEADKKKRHERKKKKEFTFTSAQH